MTGFHKVNEILMDPGIIRHLRVKCQPNLILILSGYDVSVYFGQNNHIMSLIFMFFICYRGRDRFVVINRVAVSAISVIYGARIKTIG